MATEERKDEKLEASLDIQENPRVPAGKVLVWKVASFNAIEYLYKHKELEAKGSGRFLPLNAPLNIDLSGVEERPYFAIQYEYIGDRVSLLTIARLPLPGKIQFFIELAQLIIDIEVPHANLTFKRLVRGHDGCLYTFGARAPRLKLECTDMWAFGKMLYESFHGCGDRYLGRLSKEDLELILPLLLSKVEAPNPIKRLINDLMQYQEVPGWKNEALNSLVAFRDHGYRNDSYCPWEREYDTIYLFRGPTYNYHHRNLPEELPLSCGHSVNSREAAEKLKVVPPQLHAASSLCRMCQHGLLDMKYLRSLEFLGLTCGHFISPRVAQDYFKANPHTDLANYTLCSECSSGMLVQEDFNKLDLNNLATVLSVKMFQKVYFECKEHKRRLGPILSEEGRPSHLECAECNRVYCSFCGSETESDACEQFNRLYTGYELYQQ